MSYCNHKIDININWVCLYVIVCMLMDCLCICVLMEFMKLAPAVIKTYEPGTAASKHAIGATNTQLQSKHKNEISAVLPQIYMHA